MQSTPENINENVFERELFNSLKFYGYLFPENVSEVDKFEKQFKKINKAAPGIGNILPLNNQFSAAENFDLNLSIAAYSDEENQFPEFPDEKSIDKQDENKEKQ
jgi:hypothetical protein